MDPQQFLANFGHFVDASGGVARLRKLVIQLAISGRLAEEIATGTPVSEALEMAQIQRVEYEAEHQLRSARPSPRINHTPFPIPAHWQWTRLAQVTLYVQRGKSPTYATQGRTRVVSQKCIQWDRFIHSNSRFIADETLSSYGQERFLLEGDLLWNSTGTGTAGRAALFASNPSPVSVADSHVTVIRLSSAMLPRYLWCFIASPWVQSRFHPAHADPLVTGTTQQVELATSAVRLLEVPCPPIEEQEKIVARIDELMALCDKLETQQHNRGKSQTALRQTVLQELAAADSSRELQDSWSRLSKILQMLFNTPGDVADLRHTILDLAIKGRLVEKHRTDEAASHLVTRSVAAKGARLSSGQMKRRTAPSTDVIQYNQEIPEHWERAPLDQLFQFIDYRGQTPIKTNRGVVLVTAKNVRPGLLNRHPVEYISKNSYTTWMTRGFPRVGDLLLTTEAPLGNVARIETEPAFALAQRVIDLQPFADLNTQCSMYFMMSPTFQLLLEQNSNGMTARGIKASKLKQLELPIPPIGEQARIVKKVEELLRLCGELETQLRDGRELMEKFGAAAAAGLTGIAVTQESEVQVKVPKTELIARLISGMNPEVRAHAPLSSILSRHNGEMSANDLWQRYDTDDIEAFYSQLKVEVAHGWILEPAAAEMRELVPAAEN